jgi:hypothetical protein
MLPALGSSRAEILGRTASCSLAQLLIFDFKQPNDSVVIVATRSVFLLPPPVAGKVGHSEAEAGVGRCEGVFSRHRRSSPRPACGERSRASCERVRGRLGSPLVPLTRRLRCAPSPTSPRKRGEVKQAASKPYDCCLLLSSPAKAVIQYAAAFRFHHHFYWNTGSSAFADDDGGDDSTPHHTHRRHLAAGARGMTSNVSPSN